MAAKEVMVSAPVMVLLCDRAFVSGSFAAALRARKRYYAALASTWLVLALCLSTSGFRGGTTGFGTPMTWWMYALRQCEGIVIYLKLVFWPAPLTFDYGVAFVTDVWSVLPQLILVVALVSVALWAMFFRPRAGLPGALFFAVLSPSSSFLPVVSQTLAEHRMYLPLAGVLVLAVVAARALLLTRLRAPAAAVGACVCAVAVAFGVVTWKRNQVMQSVESIWRDTVEKAPHSHRAQNNLGCALIDAKRYAEGIPYCEAAVRLKPDYGEAHGNIAYGLSGLKRHADSIPHYERALRLMRGMHLSGLDRVLLNMGLSLHEIGRDAGARAAFEEAAALNPQNAPALNNIGNYEFLEGRYAEAKTYYQRAIEADPGFAEAWYDLGNAVIALGEPWAGAEAHYRHALKLSPDLILAQDNLGRLLLAMNRPDEAAAWFKNVARENPSAAAHLNAARAAMLSGKTGEAIPMLQKTIGEDPDNIDAHYLLGNARYRQGDTAAAMTAWRRAIRLNPFAVEPHGNLGSVLAAAGQWDEAITELNAALRLKPDYAEAHNNLANARAQQGRDAEARPHYEEAIRLKPDLAQARYNYARLLLRAGEPDAARREATEALRLRPTYADAAEFLKQLPEK
jgi:tetratricopeptide (TPR) repeat protein